MKLTEVEGFPKSLLKKKTLSLYKAFYIENEGEEMNVNTSVDLLAITEEAAIEAFANEGNYWKYIQDWLLKNDPVTLSFAVFQLDMEDLKEKDFLDEGDIFFQDNIISVTLNDKLYKVDVYDKDIIDIAMEMKDGKWKITHLNMKDTKK